MLGRTERMRPSGRMRSLWRTAGLLGPALAWLSLCVISCDAQKEEQATPPARESSQAGKPRNGKVDAARLARLKAIVANGHRLRLHHEVIEELAESKADGAYEILSDGLKDRSLMFRMCSAKALGTLGDLRSLPLLCKTLKSKYTGMRLSAIVGLGKLGPKARPACSDLGELLKARFSPMHPSVRHLGLEDYSFVKNDITLRVYQAIVDALGRIGGRQAEAILVGALNRPNLEYSTVRALKRMNAREALLFAATKGSTAALRTLAELKIPNVLSIMQSQLRSPRLSRQARGRIIYSLGVLGDRQATPLLLETLRSKFPSLCRAAAWSLNRIADPASLDSLVAYVRSAPSASSGLYSATCAIGAIQTPEALEALLELANHPSPGVREAMAYRMEQRATARDIPLLVNLLKSSEEYNSLANNLQKPLARLLPESARPLLNLLPTAGPLVQRTIVSILAKHEPARPAIRELLKSPDNQVRAHAGHVLWEQRDPAVPLSKQIDRKQGFFVDQRDIPELKRLVAEGTDAQSYIALSYLFSLEPKLAWEHIQPMFYEKEQKPLRAFNAMGRKYPDWLQQEVIQMLEQPAGLSAHARRLLLEILDEADNVSAEAVKLYRAFCDDIDLPVRSRAYECLYREASDESMVFLAQRAREGKHAARRCVARCPDKRLTAAFQALLLEAIRNKDTWLSLYVHCWPHAPGITDYVALVGSPYAKALTRARKAAAETEPE